MEFTQTYLEQAASIAHEINTDAVEQIVDILLRTKTRGGRLFLVGSGGGAGHASHAVCDFRKLCEIEAYCPSDNVSELTARINDEGWDSCFANYLAASRLTAKDCICVFSVGGGDAEKNISPNLVNAVKFAKERGASIVGIVGRDGGFTNQHADACIVVPVADPSLVTPHTESFQALLWHLIVSHPKLQVNKAKWEGAVPKQSLASSIKKETDIFKIKIFADGAEKKGIFDMYHNPFISGFTTNPTLMRKAGITDYREFALDILESVKDKPISFEVFSDEFEEMELQAREIASWGENVYVKIPITNTRGESCVELIRRLSEDGVKVNVTAIMTYAQVKEVVPALSEGPGAYVSVFAGRIADTGRDPIPMMKDVLSLLKSTPHIELIWASPRELLNLVQADKIGCHIITVTNDILKKLTGLGKDLNQFSLETVKMFHDDAQAAGYSLSIPQEDSSMEADSNVFLETLVQYEK